MKLISTILCTFLITACAVKQQQTSELLEQQAISELQQGNLDSANEKLNKVLATSPQRWKSLNAKGILHSFKNELPQAEESFAAANAASPNNAAILNNWGLAIAMSGRYNEAIARLMQAVEAAPEQSRAQPEMNLALVYALSNNEKPAEMILRRYMSANDIEENLKFYKSIRKDEGKSRQVLQKAYGFPQDEDSASDEPQTILPR